jgi:hypothetical protein
MAFDLTPASSRAGQRLHDEEIRVRDGQRASSSGHVLYKSAFGALNWMRVSPRGDRVAFADGLREVL